MKRSSWCGAAVLVVSCIANKASADVGCYPDLCPPVLDGGVCEAADVGNPCAGDAGTCGRSWCAHSDTVMCLGPTPPASSYPCSDGGGCNLAAEPARWAPRAALPSFLLTVGALALLVDRRRRARQR
jgi:hypothetical protein